MVSIKKTLLLVVVASAQATPIATSLAPVAIVTEGQGFIYPTVPKGAVDISNNTALIEKLKKEHGLENYAKGVSESSANKDEFTIMGGACDQGTCPDYFKGFDMVYTWTMITTPGEGGAPPTTLVWNDQDIRVNDCDKCYRKRVGSSGGGCYDFTACGRPQQICVDEGKSRAHRLWKDKNDKTCYRIDHVGLGGCGPIVERIVWRPQETVPCNW